MKRTSLIISKYLIGAILPYFIFSWMLLSVILFVQQASRFSDIFFNVNIPASLVWQLALALVPNVVAFTCPMAILVGTIIGLARMQSDSELIAIRAAGVGTLQIRVPIAILGVLLSVFAFFVNLRGVPIAAALVRSVALQTAIKKLESPIEPGVFNTEIAGYTIYVKGGDIASGRWSNIFIHNEDVASGTTRLITSRSGRIDVTNEASELVLENATVSTIPNGTTDAKFVSESIGEVRFAIKTRRGELIEKLATSTGAPEELGLSQLAQYADAAEGRERVEANILWYRRIILSLTPLIFCLLGTSMMLRFNRAGRGSAIAVAFAGMIGYYLLAFGGEQLARTGVIPPLAAAALAPVVAFALILYFAFARRRAARSSNLKGYFYDLVDRLRPATNFRLPKRNLFVDLTTGLRDFDIGANLVKYFFFALIFLSAIFVIFTAFELWKFAGTVDGGFGLLSKYLLFLMPFVYLQLVQSATLIAVLATYVIKSRQNEIVTWVSSGQSVYRLLVPCFFLAILIGVVNFGVQEWISPPANIRQDEIRTQLRKGGSLTNTSGRFWVALDRRIYSFQLGDAAGAPQGSARNVGISHVDREVSGRPVSKAHLGADAAAQTNSAPAYHHASDNEIGKRALSKGVKFPAFAALLNISPASDNEVATGCLLCVRDLVVYEFSQDGARLQTVYRSKGASWISGDPSKTNMPGASRGEGILASVVRAGGRGAVRLEGEVLRSDLSMDGITTSAAEAGRELTEETNPFEYIRGKPSHLTVGELRSRVAQSDSEVEHNAFSVAIHRRYSTLLMPIVIALFTAPFALSLSRKGKVVTVGYAVGLWLVFVGIINVFSQFGDSGSLGPALAVWAPLLIFAMLGVFLLARVRT